MKQQRQSLKQKFGFRRRNPADDDDDLLSLQSEDKLPLNPALHSSSPKSFQRLSSNASNSLRRNRSTPLKPIRNLVVHSTALPTENQKSKTAATTTSGNSSTKKTLTPHSSGRVATIESSTTKKTLAHSSRATTLGHRSTSKALLAGQDSDRSIASSSSKRITSKVASTTLSPTSQDSFNSIVQAAHALDNVGNDLFAKGKFNEALDSYNRALKLKRRTLKFGVCPESQNAQRLLASVATSINNIGYLRQRAGANTEEIMTAYQDSLQIKREILGDRDLSVGKTLNNIGSVYFGSRAYAEAMAAYAEAKIIMEHNLGQEHLDVATVHSNIGDVHLAQRQLVEAHENYAASLCIRWAVLGEHHPKVVRLLEKIAAIEMSDTPQKMQQIQILDDEEEKADTPVQKDLRELREQVKEDVTYVDNMKRKMALEMIRDKIQMIREMRELDGDLSIHEDDDHSSVLTEQERMNAISAVKERVERIKRRKSRNKEGLDTKFSADGNDPSISRSMGQLNLEGKFDAA